MLVPRLSRARSAPVACLFRARRAPVRRTDWFRCV